MASRVHAPYEHTSSCCGKRRTTFISGSFESVPPPRGIPQHPEICVPETSDEELQAMRAEITFSPEGKEGFLRLNISLALKELGQEGRSLRNMSIALKAVRKEGWAQQVVQLDLLQWASRTVRNLEWASRW